MRKFLIKLSFLVVPIATVIIVTNICVDPANVFSGNSYVDKIATILASGNNVDNISNYDERLLQKYFLEKQKEKNPDVVIMGNSRVMEISKNIFANKKLFNISVSHANINDLIALAGLMDELKIKPKELVINVEPFLISNDKQCTNEWLTLKEYHHKFSSKYCSSINKTEINEGNKFEKYYSILSFEYFKNSLNFLLKGNNKSVENVGKTMPLKGGRLFDGSVAYSNKYQHPDTIIVANAARLRGKSVILEIDNNKLSYLKYLIDYFKSEGTAITLTMLPFHPNYYNQINEEHKNILDNYESLYKKTAIQNNIKIIGSFSAKKEKLNNVDFYDAYHCNGSAIKKIFENYKLIK